MVDRNQAIGRRRAERRQATYDELIGHARRALAAGEQLSLRSIAADMGLTPPALYRYVSSHAQLQARLSAAIYADVVARLNAAADEVTATADGPVRSEGDLAMARLLAVTLAFRRWALERPEEFRLVFAQVRGGWGLDVEVGGAPSTVRHGAPAGQDGEDAVPLAARAGHSGEPPTAESDDVPLTPWAVKFFARFMELVADLYRAGVTGAIAVNEIPIASTEAMRRRFVAEQPQSDLAELPLSVWWAGLRYWVILCGVVRMEVDRYLPAEFVSDGVVFCDVLRVWGCSLGFERELVAAVAAGAGDGCRESA